MNRSASVKSQFKVDERYRRGSSCPMNLVIKLRGQLRHQVVVSFRPPVLHPRFRNYSNHLIIARKDCSKEMMNTISVLAKNVVPTLRNISTQYGPKYMMMDVQYANLQPGYRKSSAYAFFNYASVDA